MVAVLATSLDLRELTLTEDALAFLSSGPRLRSGGPVGGPGELLLLHDVAQAGSRRAVAGRLGVATKNEVRFTKCRRFGSLHCTWTLIAIVS